MPQLLSLGDWKPLVLACLGLIIQSTPANAQAAPPPREGLPTLSGYMEMHLNKVRDLPTVVDLHRFVLMVGHSFSDRLKFWSEVEVEHAFVEVEGGEETGEVAIEQAYVDLMVNRRFNLRAGMVLVPVGIINERHEPPTFHGVERTFVTRWCADDVARYRGHLAIGRGFSYHAYAVPELDAAGFTAEELPAAVSRQAGRRQRSGGDRPARMARLLTAGASLWRSGALQVDSPDETPEVTVSSLDALSPRPSRAAGRWSMVNISGAADSTARCRCIPG